MKQELIADVMQQMLPYLDNAQLKQLRQAMDRALCRYELSENSNMKEENDNRALLSAFLSAKRIEGCSEKTLKYYRTTLESALLSLDKNVRRIMTEDLRHYLTEYQGRNRSSRVTIDNIRRILSSFFAWLEDED